MPRRKSVPVKNPPRPPSTAAQGTKMEDLPTDIIADIFRRDTSGFDTLGRVRLINRSMRDSVMQNMIQGPEGRIFMQKAGNKYVNDRYEALKTHVRNTNPYYDDDDDKPGPITRRFYTRAAARRANNASKLGGSSERYKDTDFKFPGG